MSRALKSSQVVVLGGGLAGGAAAVELARAGCSVLLLEKRAEAHDKVCGEFISLEAQHYLARAGLSLPALGAEPIRHIRLLRADRSAQAALPFQGLSLSRRVLDAALLEQAQQAGVQIRRGALATALQRQGAHWRIELAGQAPVQAETVLLATGKHDLRGWPRIGGRQNDYIGFKLHLRLQAEQREALGAQVDMLLFDGGYAGLEPIEEGKATLCLIVQKAQFARYGKRWESLLAKLLRESAPMAQRLAQASACWSRPLAIYGIPYGFVHDAPRSAPPALFRLGDQMAVIPSFSGDGMAIALHTAALAVEAYRHADARAYHRAARAELLPQIRRACGVSSLGRSRWAQSCMIESCRWFPQLMGMLATATRLPGFSTPAAAARR
jgi:flavin-dependent dehydrogenase